MTGTAESRFDARRKLVLEAARKTQLAYAFRSVSPGTLHLLKEARKAKGLSMDVLLRCAVNYYVRKVSP